MVAQAGKQLLVPTLTKPGASASSRAVVSLPAKLQNRSYMACVAVTVLEFEIGFPMQGCVYPAGSAEVPRSWFATLPSTGPPPGNLFSQYFVPIEAALIF